ncbi:hypothetical protein ACETU7_04275 [Rhodococcus sp. 3Y1]
MKRANSGLTWINQEHVTAFLTELARTPPAHDVIDQLPDRAPENTSENSWSPTRSCRPETDYSTATSTGPMKPSTG